MAAIFLSGPTIFQAFVKGIGESFGRISLFHGLAPGIFQVFRILWIQTVFGFGWRFITLVFRIPDHRVFVGYKDLLVGFHGMSDKRFSGLRISIGLSRVWILRFFRIFWIYGV